MKKELLQSRISKQVIDSLAEGYYDYCHNRLLEQAASASQDDVKAVAIEWAEDDLTHYCYDRDDFEIPARLSDDGRPHVISIADQDDLDRLEALEALEA